MEFDKEKLVEVEISSNEFVENRVEERAPRRRKIDLLDVAIVPVTIGVFVSLGFLFASLFKITAIAETLAPLTNLLGNI